MKTNKDWIKSLVILIIILLLCMGAFMIAMVRSYNEFETPQGRITDQQIRLEIEELRKTVNTMK